MGTFSFVIYGGVKSPIHKKERKERVRDGENGESSRGELAVSAAGGDTVPANGKPAGGTEFDGY